MNNLKFVRLQFSYIRLTSVSCNFNAARKIHPGEVNYSVKIIVQVLVQLHLGKIK